MPDGLASENEKEGGKESYLPFINQCKIVSPPQRNIPEM